MSKQIVPTKTVKRSHTNVVSLKDNFQQKLVAIEQLKRIQNDIDMYNLDLHSGIIPAKFKSFVVANDQIIVKLYKENFIKGWNNVEIVKDEDGSKEVVPFPFGGFRQVDARTRTSDVEQYVDTPLPYVFKGRIMAISKFSQDKLRKELGIEVNAGDFVTLNELILKDRRFYFEKQKQIMDHIANQREVVLDNFEGYFTVSSLDIETIITDIAYTANN